MITNNYAHEPGGHHAAPAPPRAHRPAPRRAPVLEPRGSGTGADARRDHGHSGHAVPRPPEPRGAQASRPRGQAGLRAARARDRSARPPAPAARPALVRERGARGAEPARRAHAPRARPRRRPGDRPRRLRGHGGVGGGRRHRAGGAGGCGRRPPAQEAPRLAGARRRERQVNPPVERSAVELGAPAGRGVLAPAPAGKPRAAMEPKSAPAGAGAVARIAVLGASGYTGQEFVRLALAHPGLAIVALASRAHAGRPVTELLPGLDPRIAERPVVVNTDAVESLISGGEVDTVVACL